VRRRIRDQKSMQQYLDRASASQPNQFVSDAPCALGENARGRKMVAKQEILKEEMRTSTARFNAPPPASHSSVLPWQLQSQFQITLVLAEIVESHSSNVAHLKSAQHGPASPVNGRNRAYSRRVSIYSRKRLRNCRREITTTSKIAW